MNLKAHSAMAISARGILCISLFACGSKGSDGSASSAATAATTAPSGKPATSAKAVASANSSAEAASAQPLPTEPPVTREAFCERAVKVGEAILAKCTKEDLSSVASLNLKNDQAKVKEECARIFQLPNVEFHGDLAAKCLAAAEKKGGFTSFLNMGDIPECVGILTGKVQEGQAAKGGEECVTGLSLLGGKCAKPAAEGAVCGASGGDFGKMADHPSCAADLKCSSGGSESDGNIPTYHCVKLRAIGGNCSIAAGDCPAGASCYQGKCRKDAAIGEQCMFDFDCTAPAACSIEGGVFGKCIAPRAAGEPCGTHEQCISQTCRAKKCLSICGSG